MRLLTWNLNYRRDIAGQMGAALRHEPDVVVFQEARRASFAEMAEHLARRGLGSFVTSADAAASPGTLGRFVVVASRFPLSGAAPVLSPAPETTVTVDVASPAGRFELVGAYVPTIARPDGVKVPTQLAIHERLRLGVDRPHVVCGDFNSPKAETPEGEVLLFTRPVRAAEFAGEHALMGGLTELGMCDAFRACNGFLANDRSWYWKNRGRTGGYRLDHIFVSAHFRSERCWYDHSVREQGLSDHSLLAADIHLAEGVTRGGAICGG